MIGFGSVSAGLIYALVALGAYLFGSTAARFICLIGLIVSIGLLGLYFFDLFEAFSVPVRYEGDLAIDNDGTIRVLLFGGFVFVPVFLGLVIGSAIQIRRMKAISKRPAIEA
jgi:hypothetical protein